MRRRLLPAVVLCALAGPVAAQSLGDAARKENERRSRARGPTKAYTGGDLGGRSAKTTPAEEPPAAAAPTPGAQKGSGPLPDSSAARAREEARWRQSVEGLRQQVSLMERETDEADRAATMSAYGGPMDCAGNVNTRHQRNLTQVHESRQALAAARKALEDFEEEARRAGVPPGWLR